MAPSRAQPPALSPKSAGPPTMAPSSRMTLASLLQPDSEEPPRRPSAPAQPLPPPASFTAEPYQPPSQHSQPHPPPPNYPPSSSQSYSSSQYPYQTSQPAHPPSQHHTPQPGHGYHPSSYTPSPTHTSSQPHHHQYHSHHHHVNSHPSLHPHPGHSHLPSHAHPVHHHQHAHHTHPHSHSHPHSHPHSLPHPHSHVHVIHAHPPASAPPNPPPASSSSAAGSPPYSSSHAFSGPGSTRGPQPIIPITPAPRSPVAPFAGASRSPSAPYPIYGAGAALASGRRSPMPAEYSSSQPLASSSSGSRRNTLSGPQAIEPVNLREYPYPAGSKHDEYPPPPAFSAPVYGPRPESPQTQTTGGNKSRRSGGGASSSNNRTARSASTKRSIGGASEAKRASDRSRERDSERELDKEREEHLYREREREKIALEREREERARDREREYDERAARERERERQVQHEMDMRDRRAPAPSKRLESDFARRPPTAEWDRLRDRGRMPREQERDWRREEEERQLGKHLPPISHGPMQGYADSSKQHMHSHSLQRHIHHYPPQPASPPPPALPPLLSPVWLGTHVYPNLPFPICLPPTLSRNNLTPEGYKPYQYTILVPCGFLPLQPATRTPRPAIALWGSPDTGYTDDSNIILAAVHSNRTTWSEIRQARKLKQDAKIIVGVWVGGANGGRNAKRPKGGAWEGRPGSGQLHSSSWGNSHDGGGMEIVQVTWLEKGAAHAPHRPNRRERMEQYAKRRADLDLVPPVKRDRIDTWYLDSDDEELAIPAKRTWDVGDTIVFGKGGTTSGFVYDPHALRSVVFEESNERSTKRLKSNAVSADVRRDIVLENDDEQYILTLNSDDKRTYSLATLSPKSKKTEVLRKSLTEEDVAFFDKGLCVWLKGDDPKDGADVPEDKDEPMENDRKGWFCRVNRWKFAPDATVDA